MHLPDVCVDYARKMPFVCSCGVISCSWDVFLSGCSRFSPQDGQSFVFPFDPIPPTNSEEKDEWDLRVHLSPPERRSGAGAGAVNPLGPVVPPVANGPADTVMQMVFNATGEFLRQLLPSTAAATAGVETVI